MYPLFKVFMSPNVIKSIENVIQSGTITQGPVNLKYEQLLERYFNVKEKILTVNSATSGLTLALRLLDLPKGSTVLCTPLTCTATNWPVLANGLNIQWVDVDPMTCNMSLEDLKSKLTIETRVVLFVHWGGYPIDLDRLKNIKEYYHEKFGQELYIIEDCAHAFGSEYADGNRVGSIDTTTIAVFSTQAIKHLTTIDGGFMIIHDESMYKRAKKLRWFGIDRDHRTTPSGDFRLEPNVDEWGYKFHMNDVNAAVGIENLNYVDENLSKIRRIANYYNETLKDVDGVELLEHTSWSEPSYWIYTIKIKSDKRDFIKYMSDLGIVCSQVHNRNDVHSCVVEYKCNLPMLDELEKEIICIPCGWWMNLDDAEYIVNSIKQWCSGGQIVIRPLNATTDWSDYLRLITLLNGQDIVGYDQVSFQCRYVLIGIDSSKIYVVEKDGQIVGTGKLLIETKFFDPVGHIEDIVIDEQYRNLNLGKKLVKFLIDVAQHEYKCYKVVLNANETVTPFYVKCNLEFEEYNTSKTYRLKK